MELRNFGPFAFARLGRQAVQDLNRGLEQLIAGRLWLKIVLALILGVGCGFLMGPEMNIIPSKWSHVIVSWLALPGQLFLSLIQLVIIPLVFASVVLGIVSSDSIQQLKSLGLRVGVYYLLTTVISVSLGFLVAYTLKPGLFVDSKLIVLSQKSDSMTASSPPKLGSWTEVMSGLIPGNPFSALVTGEMLQIVLLAIFIGVALMSLKNEEARPLIDLLNSFQKISMTVISWAMRLAPLAVFGLTARLLTQLGLDALVGLSFYVLTVILGLFLIYLFYLLLIFFLARENPLIFMSKIREVQLLAFSTSSSASVMPLTIETAEKKLGVKSSISQFIIPLGTTVNMGGTALYQGVATVFLAQVFQIDLSLGQLSLVVLTATLSTIGAPGAPGVGMAVLSVILSNVGIPPSGIVLIIGVDRILDMCRTVINVTGDLVASVIMNRFESSQ